MADAKGRTNSSQKRGCVLADDALSTGRRSSFLGSLPEAFCTHLLDFLPVEFRAPCLLCLP